MAFTNYVSFGALALVLISSFTLGGCASQPEKAAAAAIPAPVAAVPASVKLVDADLSTFVELLNTAKLADVINAQPVTFFAPTNEAFANLGTAALDKLKSNPEQLKAVLQYHIVRKKLMAGDVTENTSAETLGGQKLAVSKAGDFITLDESMVVQADVLAAYGVVHKVDRVLTPPAAKK